MRHSTKSQLGLWLALGTLVWSMPALGQDVPALTGRVVDEGDILSPSTEETITTLLAAHEAATSNQVAVLTISSLGGETVEAYSIRVAETWGLGTAEKDNGVLLLVAVSDREMRIEVGLGLEGVLTDAAASRIIRNEMVPRFRSGDFDGGVLLGVERIVGVIDGTYTPVETSDDWPPIWFGIIFIAFPSLFAFFGLMAPGAARWFLFVFLIPFYWVGGLVVTRSVMGATIVAGIYAVLFIVLQFLPAARRAQKANKSSGGGSGWSSSSSSSWSSSSSSSFSGGGGSFGGGGSSGSW